MIYSPGPVTTANVAAHYDDLDIFYREIWGEHVHHGLWEKHSPTPELAVRNLVRTVARLAAIEHGTRVCDVGCGYGATARMLVQECGAVVTGLTISEAQYRYATAASPDSNPDYRLEDWLHNSVPTASADVLIAIESSEHMENKDAFFQQAYRVLKPDGRAVICAWLASERPPPGGRSFLLEPICHEGCLPSLGTESDYARWIAAAGFTLNSVKDVTRNVRKTWTVCARRLAARFICDDRYRKFALNSKERSRVFAITIARIWLAYFAGAMRYGIFSATKK